MTDYNLDDLFGKMETETKLTSELLMPKKGDDLILFMLPPKEYNGSLVLSVMVHGTYQEKETTQHIVRFLKVEKNGSNLNWEKVQYVGIPLPATIVAQLANSYKNGFQLAQQEASVIRLQKPQKTTIMIAPKTIKIPDVLWDNDNLAWETLIEQYSNMQMNMSKKNEKEVEMPF